MIDADILTRAIVEVEENKLNPDCLNDTCDHADGECPDNGIDCGDAKALAEEYEKIRAALR